MSENFEISASDEVFNTNETENVSPLKKSPKKTKAKDSKPNKQKAETIAIHSTKNVFWPEVGRVYSGYNIVEKEISEKWLTRDHIRIATPEEVAREFGVI